MVQRTPRPRRIGIVDTTFARFDMGGAVAGALAPLDRREAPFELVRRTVPGFKDLAVAAKALIQNEGCGIVVACGMAGGEAIDTQCAHEASQGLMLAQLMTTTPIIEVFVHTSEAADEGRLAEICAHRCTAHALNAHAMLFDPDSLIARAGQGVRQGGPDAGPLAITAALVAAA